MASLQIPFSRWDWPNSETQNNNNSNIRENNHHIHSHTSSNHCSNTSKNNNHRSDFLNCSHPKSNPLASSLSSLSAMLLEGQAVLAHQNINSIWLFIGLSNGTIWKWTINMVSEAEEIKLY